MGAPLPQDARAAAVNAGGRARGAARVAVGVLLVALLIRQADFREIAAALVGADAFLCLLGFLFFGGVAAVETGRLMLIYRRYPISLGGAAYLYFTGAFFANFLPGSAGGDVYRLHLLRRLEDGLARPLGLLFLLRASAFFVMVVMALIWGGLSLTRLRAQLPTPIFVDLDVDVAKPLAVALGVAVLALVLPVGRRMFRRLGPPLQRAIEASRAVSATELAVVSGLGVGVWVLRTASLYFFALALDLSLLFGDVFLVMATANLVSLLPISIGSFGIREGALAGALSLLGVPFASGVALALLSRCALWLVTLGGAGLHLARGRVGREELLGRPSP